VARDGRVGRIGHPHALIELYESNYVSLCATVFARELVAAGCRFDESLDIYEDWDFALQLAQQASFHFVPLESYEWRVDAGESGAGLGANRDAERVEAFRQRIREKWAPLREALVARVAPLLEDATALAQRGDVAGAQARCREALAASPNDPYALNVAAMVMRAAGDLRTARAMQELAVAIRSRDPGMVYNLAVLCRAQGDDATARRCCDRVLALSPGFAPAHKLAAELPAEPA
jgi:tetratricopeptide (TPR) repeat protein